MRETSTQPSTLQRIQLPLFFFLAYAITWSAQIPAYLAAYDQGQQLSNEANVVHFRDLTLGTIPTEFSWVLLLFSFSFGPSIAGIIVIALVQGKPGLKMLLRRLVKVRIPGRWILVILLIPILLGIASLLIGQLLSGFAPLDYTFLMPLSLAPAFLLYLIVFTGLSEEIGWRGYALPELQRRHSAEKASWIVGIAWGLWHLPSSLLTPYLLGELTLPLVITTLLALTLGIVGWTIVLTWIFNNTGGSLFWIIVLHGFGNWVQSYLVLSSGNYMAQVAYGVLPWAIAIVVLKKYGSATLTGSNGAAVTPTSPSS